MVALMATYAMIQTSQTSALVRIPLILEASEGLGASAISKSVDPGFEWDEAVPSWNVANSQNAVLTVHMQVVQDGRGSAWYQLAEWHGDMSRGTRASVPNQSDADAEVLTDVLRTKSPLKSVRMQLSLQQLSAGPAPKLKLLTISFSKRISDAKGAPASGPISPIEAPQLAQGPFEFGKLEYNPERVSPEFESWFRNVKSAQYCSPTSVAMVMKYWSAKLGRPDLDVSVPDAVAGVFDSKYPGTGNWPFNTAYMGSFPRMRGYVTRLRGMRDLEDLTSAGVPVVCSVSHNLVLGNGKPAGGDGHLVVVVGFEEDGDLIANDPGKTDRIRRVFHREDFLRGWNVSNRTTYVCHPERWKIPKSLQGVAIFD